MVEANTIGANEVNNAVFTTDSGTQTDAPASCCDCGSTGADDGNRPEGRLAALMAQL